MKRHGMMLGAMALVGAMVLVAASDASARNRGQGRRGGKGMGHGGKLFKALDLTVEQKKQMIRLRAAMQEDMVVVHEQIKAKRTEMRDLWAADEPDEAAILAKHDEMTPLKRQMHVRKIKFRLAARELLTDEQKTKLQHMIKKGGKGFGHGHGKGHGPGGWGGPGQ